MPKLGFHSLSMWVGGLAHPVIQGTIIVVYVLAFIYSIISIFGLVPAGWA
ncbi:hypothetical protein J3S22_00730 [Corynebacterium aurimucosum]|nr:hypothetical protein [Corynebacterium aurimucosum]UTA71665.1 hypothetical protein J3S22_00730 [Corynebacterium aurimucosum]